VSVPVSGVPAGRRWGVRIAGPRAVTGLSAGLVIGLGAAAGAGIAYGIYRLFQEAQILTFGNYRSSERPPSSVGEGAGLNGPCR